MQNGLKVATAGAVSSYATLITDTVISTIAIIASTTISTMSVIANVYFPGPCGLKGYRGGGAVRLCDADDAHCTELQGFASGRQGWRFIGEQRCM